MLHAMRLVDQWRGIETELPDDWIDVVLSVVPESPEELPNVAAMLGPMGPNRVGEAVRVTVRRAGGASGPEAARRLFGLLDERRVWSTLTCEMVRSQPAPEKATATATAASSLTRDFDAALAELPADWSDLLCELTIDSSDLLPRAALLCSPINPTRTPTGVGFTFRVAQRTGYGVSPSMARRCFERCDAEGLGGSVRVLRVLSDTDNVATQGPVWYVGGKAL
jgi:hypothetical protein